MEQCGEDHIIGERPDDCFACLSEQRDELLSALKALRETSESFVNLARTRGEDLREEASHRVRNALAVARDVVTKVHGAELESQKRNGVGVFNPRFMAEDDCREAQDNTPSIGPFKT